MTPTFVTQTAPTGGPRVLCACSGLSHKWSHTVCVLFDLAFFIQHNVFSITHVVMCDRNSLLFIIVEYSIVWIYCNLFIFSSIEVFWLL